MEQPKIDISLLGGLTIRLNGTAVTNFASRKAEALLVYLGSNPGPNPRETLAALLWPENDQSRALGNLSVVLSSLRKQLPGAVTANRHTIEFNPEIDRVLDTIVFKEAVGQAQAAHGQKGKLSRTTAAQLETAVALYKGDFLAGFYLRNAPDFEAWVLLEQEHLRHQYLTALRDLITFHQQRGQLDQAIIHAQRFLAVDPLQESVHVQLMHLYLQNDQRAAALAQYEQCVRVLDEELGVEPGADTVLLYEAAVAGEVSEGQPLAHWVLSKGAAHNLPAATTSFVGRDRELARIERWLNNPNGRLLTIAGPGGIGKSRLALEAARTAVGQFADGVWFVSLVSTNDLNGLITAAAATVGLALSGTVELAQQLRDHIRDQEMLLVLDNLEHLVTPLLLDFIGSLCEQAPELRIITTSRERLRLQAEKVLDLRGLSYPTEKLSDGQRLAEFPAVQLLVNRVGQVRNDFRLEKEVTAVSKLCQLVGGLPLALELAATWTRVLSIEEIVSEIQHSLESLSTNLHDVPERHRSIQAVIQSAWEMLPTADKALLRKLAVFYGGFNREAAQAVADAQLPQLMSLADRSFLRLDGDHRFRRHPLLLQFTRKRFAELGLEGIETQNRHASYFANFVRSLEMPLQGERADEALDAMESDWENIKTAWGWALSRADVAHLDDMVRVIGTFLRDSSRFIEGVDFFTRSYLAETIDSQPVQVKIQVQLGGFLHEIGELDEAAENLKLAVEQATEMGLQRTRIEALRNLAEVTQDRGDRTLSKAYLEAALQLCQTEPEKYQFDKMLVLSTLGKAEVFDGRFEQAREHMEAAMLLARKFGKKMRIAILHNNIAVIANSVKDYQEAISQYQKARKIFVEQDFGRGIAATSLNIGIAALALGHYDEALDNVQTAQKAYEKMGIKRGIVSALSITGNIYRKKGDRRRARQFLYDSLRLALDVELAWSALGTLAEVAELEMSYGELDRAALILSFIVEHEATPATTLENVKTLLEELQSELPATALSDVKTAVAGMTLERIISGLLKDSL